MTKKPMIQKRMGRRVAAPKTAHLGNPLMPNSRLQELYTAMLQSSVFAERIERRIQRRKLSCVYLSCKGREAIAAGTVVGLREGDWVAPQAGDDIAAFLKGMPLSTVLSRFEKKSPKQKPESGATPGIDFQIVPTSPAVATQLDRAAGVAIAHRGAKDRGVVIAFVGAAAGRASKRHALIRSLLNDAALWMLPMVFVIETDSVAGRSSSRRRAASFESDGYHLPVIPVDGRDVVALYRVASESIHKARNGGGPTLIEAQIPKPGGKFGDKGAGTSPSIAHMEEYLTAKGLFSEKWKRSVIERFERELDAAVALIGR